MYTGERGGVLKYGHVLRIEVSDPTQSGPRCPVRGGDRQYRKWAKAMMIIALLSSNSHKLDIL